MVEGATGIEDVLGRALGARVAAAEGQGLVREGQRVGAPRPLGLRVEDLVGQRHHVGTHRGAEALNVLATIGEPAHAVVAQRDKVIVAKRPAHLRTHSHKLVIQAVKLGLVALVPGALRLPGS